eukprot:14122302-Heterocapsa_arctica.AAC.1
MAPVRLRASSSDCFRLVLCEPGLAAVVLVLVHGLPRLLLGVLGPLTLPIRLALVLPLPLGRTEWEKEGLPVGLGRRIWVLPE